jgi:alpha-glucosidase
MPADSPNAAVASASELEKDTAKTTLTAELPFTSVAVGSHGLAGQGLGVFYPASLAPKDATPSLAMIQRPRIERPLPASWKLSPLFSTNGASFRAEVSLPADFDLYGGGMVTGPLRRNGTAIKV